MRQYWADDEGSAPAAAAAADDGYGSGPADAEASAGGGPEAAGGDAEASADAASGSEVSGGDAEPSAVASHTGVSDGHAEVTAEGHGMSGVPADDAGGSDPGSPTSALAEVDEAGEEEEEEEEIPPSQPDEPLQPQPEVKPEVLPTMANPEVKPTASLEAVVGGQLPKSEDAGKSPPDVATSTPPAAMRDASMPPPKVPEKRLRLGGAVEDPSLQKSRQLVLARIQVLKAELDKNKSREATNAITACFFVLQQEV